MESHQGELGEDESEEEDELEICCPESLPLSEKESQQLSRMKIVSQRWKDNPELLLPTGQDPECDLFEQAIAVAFDVPLEYSDLLDDMCNRDLLWYPRKSDGEDYDIVNYFQLAKEGSTEREPIESTFCYLFSKSEPYYNEPYMFDQEMLDLRMGYYQYIRQKYSCVDEYIALVINTLAIYDWDNYVTNYGRFVTLCCFNEQQK